MAIEALRRVRAPSRRRVAAVALWLATLGCSRTLASRADASSSSRAPLDDFCRATPCTYDAHRAWVAALPSCTHGETGECGALRYVELETADGSETVYFDASGDAVAAETSSDMGKSARYGLSPACAKHAKARLCGIAR